MEQILTRIKQKPGLYLGNTEHRFTSLVNFIGGWELGYAAAKRGHDLPERLVAYEFHKFVTQRFGCVFPDGGKGWETFIRENSASEKEAFDLFFSLLEDYEKTRREKNG